MNKKDNEKKIIKVMIDIYQRKHHNEKMCEELLEYAYKRIDCCPFIETKTFCSACKVHCYQDKYRQQIKQVMRYSGKYMLFYHPILAIKHIYITLKERGKGSV